MCIWQWRLFFFWSISSFALVPALQIKTMQIAHDAPALVSSVNIGAFNLGNAIGAIIGGIALKYSYNIVAFNRGTGRRYWPASRLFTNQK